jgi:membrane-bound lytic murein transglycosylase D
MDPELLDLSSAYCRLPRQSAGGRRHGRSDAVRALAAAGLAIVLAGCASSRPPPPQAQATPPAPPPPPPPPAVATIPPEDSLSAEEVRDLAALQAETFRAPVGSNNADLDEELESFLKVESDALLTEQVDYDIPIVINERVEYYIDYFQNRVSKSFAKWLARSPQVVPYIQARFQQAGLPEDLIYISLIESGFSPLATSRSKAVGYWQFVSGTARRYGLRVDRWVDERRDLERSTEAAIAYLQDLHRMFGSWYLAAAAYNSGEAKIQKAIEKYRSENLWELAEFSYLRSETKDYVPKLIAATLIAKEPQKYGFGDVVPLPYLAVDTVTIPSQTNLRVIAAAAGTSVETIRSLNPSLRSHATPPDVRDYSLKVPRGSSEAFAARLASVPPTLRVEERTYVVRPGDTPSRIAAKHGVTAADLMAENEIRNPRTLRVGQRLRIPVDEEIELPPQLADLSGPTPEAEDQPGGAEGEGSAAVGLADSAAPGVAAPADSSPAPDQPEVLASADPVESGAPAPAPPEALGSPGDPAPVVAEGGEDLAADSTPPSYAGAPGRQEMPPMVRVGQDTPRPIDEAGEADGDAAPEPVRSSPPRVVRYQVRPGDSLYRIALQHGVTVGDLRRWNPDLGSRIHPGHDVVVNLSEGQAVLASAAAGAGDDDGVGRAAAPVQQPLVLRVERGDTLWSIARRHGVTADQVRRWNGLDGSAIRAGDRLVLFPGGADRP